MNRFKTASTLCGLALIALTVTTSVKADEWNKKTVITFSGPVEIPGVHLKGWAVLPAGTYVFKLMDSSSDRHIVQIFNKDENVIYATILAIPNYRLTPTDKTVVTFRERPAGEPEALRAWFYPGDNYGEEFVYPKAKAVVLAKTENAPVMFTQSDSTEVTEPIKPVDRPAAVSMAAAPVQAVQPTGEVVEVTTVTAPAPAPVAATTAPELPHTASHLPLISMIGLLALGGVFVLRTAAGRV